MTQYRSCPYGPFELGRSYDLEYRARAEYRTQLIDRDLSSGAISLAWRLYFPPGASGTTFVVNAVGTKLSEDGGTAGATGLVVFNVTIPTNKGTGTVIVEVVAIDSGVPDASTPSGFREVPLDAPTQTSLVSAPIA